MLAPRPWAAELLHFWFEVLGPSDWFTPSAAVDAELARRFANDLHALGACSPEAFLPEPRVTRAAILLFDQVPRNLHRDTALAWAWDGLARELARSAIAHGVHRGLSRAEAQFVAMPLMHSEDIADQNASTAFFARHGDAHTLRFARAHREMVARFGRFPHRNEALGRESSAAERRAIENGFDW